MNTHLTRFIGAGLADMADGCENCVVWACEVVFPDGGSPSCHSCRAKLEMMKSTHLY